MLRTIAQMAVLLGIVFEAAVWGWTPGIGHVVFWLCAVTATIVCNRAAERRLLPAPWMFVPPLFFAASVFLYDAGVVRIWSSFLGMLTLLWAVGWNLTREREPGALARLFPASTFNPARLISAGGETWRPVLSTPNKPSGALLRGILLAVPLLLIFGGLLCSADMVFERALESISSSAGRVSLGLPVRLIIWLMLFGSWLKLWLSAGRAEAPSSRSPLGSVELLVAVGSVNVLFLLFLAIQVRYLFGGAALVEALGLNYAEYARKGFFELSACIALILPLVMLAYSTARTHADTNLRWAGGALVLQAGGLAVSAFRRMMLYIDTFGLSVERFYAAAGILVALAVLAWAAFACFSPRDVSWVLARQTVTVAFALGFLALLNVEDGICRYNLSRAARGQELDVAYLSTLSCDAVPALLQGLPSNLSPAQREQVQQVVRGLVGAAGPSYGPSTNLSRDEARRLAAALLPPTAEAAIEARD